MITKVVVNSDGNSIYADIEACLRISEDYGPETVLNCKGTELIIDATKDNIELFEELFRKQEYINNLTKDNNEPKDIRSSGQSVRQ